MLLDDLMPIYDVIERHRIVVRAPPDVVFAAIRKADLGGGAFTRALFGLRSVPAAVVAVIRSPRSALAELQARCRDRGRRLRLHDFERAGFRIVAERPTEELVIGLLGQFWTPRGGLCADLSVERFRQAPPSGYALAGWNFTVAPWNNGATDLRTETRVWCAPDARTKFRAYWILVRPGSGLIRRAMLQAIRQEAERCTRTSPRR